MFAAIIDLPMPPLPPPMATIFRRGSLRGVVSGSDSEWLTRDGSATVADEEDALRRVASVRDASAVDGLCSPASVSTRYSFTPRVEAKRRTVRNG